MEELRITHVEKSKNVVTHIEIDDKLYPTSTIIDWVINKVYRFYTLEDGFKSYVIVKRSPLGNLYLVTSPDGIECNNLGSLSQ